MKFNLSHVAIWCSDLEQSREFYMKYFNGRSNEKYVNPLKGFSSYFVTFDSGAAIEMMQRTDITAPNLGSERLGLAHFAFTVGSPQGVHHMVEALRSDGYTINSEPRTTGDGFYEASALDPDGNIIEIVA